MSRPTTVLAGACAALLALVLSPALGPAGADVPQPSPGTHDFTTTDALMDVLDGPDGQHPVTIDTRLYRPDNATVATPQPAILMTHGFGGSKLAAEVTNMASFLASHGYVVLTYTSQGFGDSSGCIALQSRTYDVKDTRQLITKVLEPLPYVERDAAGAIVGMVGGSYGGGIQLNLAETDSRIRAIAPYRTWNSLQYALHPNNWVVPGDPTGFTHTMPEQGVFKRLWATEFFASGESQPAQGNGGCLDEPLGGDQTPCPGFYLPLCETYLKISATGDTDATDRAIIADSSGSTDIDRLRVPTLLVQGQSDTVFNLNDAVATYAALRRNHVPVKMIWNAGGHGGYNSQPGECESFAGGGGVASYHEFDDCYLPLRTLAFFDQWLRGLDDPSPGFTFFRDWVAYDGSGATNAYGQAPSFPLSGTRTYTLSGSSDLTTGVAVPGSATILNPVGGQPAAYTETSNFSGPDSDPNLAAPPIDIPGQHADFTSPAFSRPAMSVGVPSVHLRLSHEAPTDLVIFAKVWDVAPDGTATLIHRLISPARIPTASLDQAVDVKLIGFAHRWETGHRVRLTLCTTDATSFNNPVADVITIRTGPGTTFTLPFKML